MAFSGGCYCGDLRYEVTSEVAMRAMCLCRECQRISGGGPNFSLTVPEEAFAYTSGIPRIFARNDIDRPVGREFCGTCGTHVAVRSSRVAGHVIVKAGSLDDPAVYAMPAAAVYVSEAQPYHCIPDGVARFDKFPQRG
jgi:hypothetical protein